VCVCVGVCAGTAALRGRDEDDDEHGTRGRVCKEPDRALPTGRELTSGATYARRATKQRAREQVIE
jgi:hypothetical protein